MVSFNVYRATSSGAYIEGVCLATDEKPITGIANGSILYAVDASDGTTTRYMFDQSTASWIEAECPCSGGGSSGGGSSGGEVFFVNVHTDILGDPTGLSNTYGEIREAVAAGRYVVGRINWVNPEDAADERYEFAPMSEIYAAPAETEDVWEYVVSFPFVSSGLTFYANGPDEMMQPGGGGPS